jgi:poly(hydroxyalkanoate) granule-associated protein
MNQTSGGRRRRRRNVRPNLTEDRTMTKKTKSTKLTKFAPKEILANTAERAQESMEVVQETAQNIWLAGLGALTLAEDQGGKVFKALVKRGAAIDSKNRKALSAIVKDVEARVEVVKETVVDATSGTVNRIGSGVESGMATVMHTLGVPTRSEIQTLTRKVDALTKSVEHKAKSVRKTTHRAAKKATTAAASGTPSF